MSGKMAKPIYAINIYFSSLFAQCKTGYSGSLQLLLPVHKVNLIFKSAGWQSQRQLHDCKFVKQKKIGNLRSNYTNTNSLSNLSSICNWQKQCKNN